MNITQDLKSHFSKFPKFTSPDGITFFCKKDYDTYMKIQNEIKECNEIVQRLHEKIDDEPIDEPH